MCRPHLKAKAPEEQKRCNGCHQHKPLYEFSSWIDYRATGQEYRHYQSVCKKCKQVWRREYDKNYIKNLSPERREAYRAQARERARRRIKTDEYRAYRREYNFKRYHTDPEYREKRQRLSREYYYKKKELQNRDESR